MAVSTRRYDENVFINCPFDRDRPTLVIEAVRNFLRVESGLTDIPGWEYIRDRYRKFKRDLPEIARIGHLNPAKLTYADYCEMIKRWLDLNARD